ALAEIERNLGTQFHPVVGKAFVAVQRGVDPADVLTADELAPIRGASAPSGLRGLPGPRDLTQRPDLLALAGRVLLLGGLGFQQGWVGAVGVWLGVTGVVLQVRARTRSARLADALRAAVQAPDVGAVFAALLDLVGKSWPLSWGALVAWDEDGL